LTLNRLTQAVDEYLGKSLGKLACVRVVGMVKTVLASWKIILFFKEN